MTFKQWLLSELPNPRQSPYTTLYLISLVCLIAFVVISSILLKNKSQKTKRNVMMVFAIIITVVAVVRKVVNFVKTPDETLHDVLWILLSRPGCAISALLAIIAVVVNKKWAYTFASLIGLLCGTAFFASPAAGFDRELIQFEEVYSIVLHVGFYVMALCFVTYRLAEFKFSQVKNIAICFGVLAVYVAFLMLTKVEKDPFLFLPNGDVHQLVGGMKYGVFLPLYFVFATVFFLSFFIIGDRKAVKEFFNKLSKKA